MYFDTHAHYDDQSFDDDREELLNSLPEQGVQFVVNAASDLQSSRRGISLAKQYPYLYAAVGVHPHETQTLSHEEMEELFLLSQDENVVAIGEIGLDYYYDKEWKDQQIYWFHHQLELAEKTDLPVIIHCREASAQCFSMISESAVRKGVIHCFSGSPELAKEYVKLGFYIGVGGVVTFPNAKKLIETVESIPLEHLLLETDCPYLSPVPKRGKRNDSRNLPFIAEKIAEVKKISLEDVVFVTECNAKKLFFEKSIA